MTDRLKEIEQRHLTIVARETVADQQTEDIAYLLDALRHMTESWQTAQDAIEENQHLSAAILRVEQRLEEMECGPEEGPHRRMCPGCRRVDEIRAALEGE
jgi:hypothetical protein